MPSNGYECPMCHKRKRAAFGSPRCTCGAAMVNVTNRTLYTYECPRCHTRKRAALGTPRCGCGGSMLRVN